MAWEYKIIDYYEETEEILKNVKLLGYEKYDLANLIAAEIHKSLLLTRFERIKRMISYILCDKAKCIIKHNSGGD